MSETKKRLRWGILGVAKINDRLMPAFKRSKTVDLYGIASRSLDKAQESAKKNGITKAYGNYEDLLNDPAIEAVYNPLPNSMHDEWTRKAADKGKHILCEKPLTPTAKESEALIAYCRKKGVRLMDGFMWPHHPRTHQIRKLIDDGGIGRVERVTGALSFKMDPLSPSNIRLQPELGGGSLLDVGCYPVYGIRWAFGEEPVKAFARAKMMNGVDVEMTGQLLFADGRMASFDCGFTLPLRGWLEITGEKGSIRIPEMWLPNPRATFQILRDDKETEEICIEGHDQMEHMLDVFAYAVWENREPYPNPDQAVKTLKVLDALTQSVREAREVAIG
jgi:xylose dehydrogenase (NAD/NADP)